MKINRKEVGDTRFVDLDVGEVFNFGGPFMKVDAEDTAVNLQSGNLHHFPRTPLSITFPTLP